MPARRSTAPRERRRSAAARAIGLLVGYLADRCLGDPQRFHPVAGFGALATELERRSYRDDRGAGVVHALLLVGGAVGGGAWLDRVTRRRPAAHVLAVAVATWAVLGGRSLEREARAVGRHLEGGDLLGARRQITHLVGRDPTTLDEAGLARATVESVAENTSDAVVGPLCWGAIAGLPGLLGYRAANTLDAMVGHRTARYRRFGWASARLDDALNLVPARVTELLAACSASIVGGSATHSLRVAHRDGGRHPSPNAGPVEAAFAGALGVRLGGVNVYDGAPEDRGTLGDGRAAELRDIARAVRLSRSVGIAAAALAVGLVGVRAGRLGRRRPHPRHREQRRTG